MTYEQRLKIYLMFINLWGVNLQLVMAIEEMSELQKEMTKAIRGKQRISAIIEEVSDVQIMLEQIKLIFNISENEITSVIDFKLNRSLENIKKEETK